jgi:N6-adenosine-specific RNA methylase IME4
MYPELPKIELFARHARPGWAAWGNQAAGDATRAETITAEMRDARDLHRRGEKQ